MTKNCHPKVNVTVLHISNAPIPRVNCFNQDEKIEPCKRNETFAEEGRRRNLMMTKVTTIDEDDPKRRQVEMKKKIILIRK